MKKLAFLAILLTISVVGFTQPAYMEPIIIVTMDGGLPKYCVNPKYNRVSVRHLASNSISKFKLIDFVRNTEKHLETRDKKFLYKLFFIRMNDGKMFVLESYNKKELLSALNNDDHYIYTDGKKLFIVEKK